MPIAAPTALSLVLDPRSAGGRRRWPASWARRLSCAGVVVPPQVERVLHRWLPIAGQRAEAEGWSAAVEPEPDPWERPELFAQPSRAGGLDRPDADR